MNRKLLLFGLGIIVLFALANSANVDLLKMFQAAGDNSTTNETTNITLTPTTAPLCFDSKGNQLGTNPASPTCDVSTLFWQQQSLDKEVCVKGTLITTGKIIANTSDGQKDIRCFYYGGMALPTDMVDNIPLDCFYTADQVWAGVQRLPANTLYFCKDQFNLFTWFLLDWKGNAQTGYSDLTNWGKWLWLLIGSAALFLIAMWMFTVGKPTIRDFIRSNWDGFMIVGVLALATVLIITKGDAWNTTAHTMTQIVEVLGTSFAVGAAIGTFLDVLIK